MKITQRGDGLENKPKCGTIVVVEGLGRVTALAQSWCLSGQPKPRIKMMKVGDSWK
jgi:hypothetical protein